MNESGLSEIFDKVYHLRDAGRLDEAADILKRIINDVPSSSNARIELADILIKKKDMKAAEEELRAAVKLPEVPARAYFELAKLLKDKDEFDESKRLLKTALDKDPKSADAAAELALIYERSLPAAEASNKVLKLIEEFPESIPLRMSIGAIYEKIGEDPRAKEEYLSAENLNPHDVSIIKHLARINKKMGVLKESEKYYRELIKIAPEDGENHMELAAVLSDAGKRRKALDELKKAVKKGYSEFNVYKDMYFMYSGLGEYSEALREIEKTLKAAPEKKYLHAILARLYFDSGDYKVFKEELKNILRYSLQKEAESLTSLSDFSQNSELNEVLSRPEPFRPFLTWNITYKCNYSCSYCSVIYTDRAKGAENKLLSPAEWENVWRKIYSSSGPLHLNISGGEPFVYPEFLQILKKVLKYHTAGLQTNLFWDPDEFINEIPLERVNICASFHPENIEIGEFIRKVKLLKEAGASISVNYVAFPPQIKNLEEILRAFRDAEIVHTVLPYTGIYEGRSYPRDYTESEREELSRIINDYRTTDAHLLWWLKQKNDEVLSGFIEARSPDSKFDKMPRKKQIVEEKSDTKLHQAEEEYINNPEKFKGLRLCRMGEMYAIISPSGRVVRCCADSRGLGNILDGSFRLAGCALPCSVNNCRCFKAMIPGKENEWALNWVPTEKAREVDYLRMIRSL